MNLALQGSYRCLGEILAKGPQQVFTVVQGYQQSGCCWAFTFYRYGLVHLDLSIFVFVFAVTDIPQIDFY
ncbi:hypothetical protein [Pseudomonas oryzihabitans]|uniref:hypothetical protein n=1 Tax=Pseudomonas oryzihabitans TaxID=47885 RepID=UPI00286C29A8|nr:hypothetical protein [Pseudomonas psychrotolerans]